MRKKIIQSLTYEQLQASGFDFNADFYYRLNSGERGRQMGVEVRHTEIRQVSCLLVGNDAQAWLHAEHYWLLTDPVVIEQRSYGKHWELPSKAPIL